MSEKAKHVEGDIDAVKCPCGLKSCQAWHVRTVNGEIKPLTKHQAKHVIKCWNCHDELVEALKKVHGWLRDLATVGVDAEVLQTIGAPKTASYLEEVIKKAEAE